MIRSLLLLSTLLLAVATCLPAQVDPDSRPSSRPSSQDEAKNPRGKVRSQEEIEAHLDLVIPKHDEKSRHQDEATGVVWSFLKRNEKTDLPTLVIGDRVRAHMTVWLAKDGTEISSSRRREGIAPNPETFDTGAFVRGLNVVMPNLRPGDKVRIDVPARMAFGKKGLRGRVPPDADLIYALQVLEVTSHTDIPPFVAWDEAKANKVGEAEEGMPAPAYMILVDGQGDMAGDQAAVAFDYVMRDEWGNIIDSSLFADKAPMGGQVGRLGLEVFNTVGRISRPGGHYLLRLPLKAIFRGEVLAIVDPDGQYVFIDMMPRDIAPFREPGDAEMKKDANGFEYRIIRPGIGETLQPDERAHIHYAYFTLPEGQLIEASYTRGITNNFSQVGLIAGMRQALAKIAPGGMIRARIPAELAWGPTGRVGVGPNTDILLQLELFPEALPTRNPRNLQRKLEAGELPKDRKKKGKGKRKDKAQGTEEGDGEAGKDGAGK
ncbi:MAG: FKBP-type peptidyl-prolyl cis-trans isomerase [Planctomycetes bacterium]|nr:FKBP-type peptidyl-prolyl cis-trans isomerase [Planctomycetota bacterium]